MHEEHQIESGSDGTLLTPVRVVFGEYVLAAFVGEAANGYVIESLELTCAGKAELYDEDEDLPELWERLIRAYKS